MAFRDMIRSADGDVLGVGPMARLDPYRHEGLLVRLVPFFAAVTVAFVLLPLQKVTIDAERLTIGIVQLVVIGLLVFLYEWYPDWLKKIAPYVLLGVFMSASEQLRDATGGSGSGYGAIMYLAVFWSALHGTRRHTLFAIAMLFIATAGVMHGNPDLLTLRRAALTAFVIGFISIAVQRQVTLLVAASARIAQESEARTQTVAQLEQVNSQLERSNAELERFAYVSSHDLQEPLRMIRSFSQLFVQRHGDELDDDARELLSYVVDGAERSQELVQDLLEYSRVGMTGPEFTKVDLELVVDRALATLAPRLAEHDVKVERMGTLPTVHGDANKLVRVFTNVIGNSIKYHHPDRVPVVAIVAHSIGDGRHQIDVIDNGIGFEQEHAERIFSMFQRLHVRGEYEGTGIGLAICSRIIEQHGGTITADGTPERGATFSIVLGGE